MDLKMVNFLLGQQSGYTKYPCSLCMCDSKAKNEHWARKEWPLRKDGCGREKHHSPTLDCHRKDYSPFVTYKTWSCEAIRQGIE